MKESLFYNYQKPMFTMSTHLIVVTGSKWCGLMPKKSKAKALKKEDRCCKKWHHCETSIAGMEL